MRKSEAAEEGRVRIRGAIEMQPSVGCYLSTTMICFLSSLDFRSLVEIVRSISATFLISSIVVSSRIGQ